MSSTDTEDPRLYAPTCTPIVEVSAADVLWSTRSSRFSAKESAAKVWVV